MPESEPKFALYSPLVGWLQDLCAGGLFDWDVGKALWFDNREQIDEALKAAEIELTEQLIIRMK